MPTPISLRLPSNLSIYYSNITNYSQQNPATKSPILATNNVATSVPASHLEHTPSAEIPDDGNFMNELSQFLGPSFSRSVREILKNKGLTPPDVYNKIGMDRRLFSKILKDEKYRPNKVTVLKIALGLELGLQETLNLLKSAGFTLSHSILFDVIMEYCIVNGNYDVYGVGDILKDFALDKYWM